MAIYDVTDLKVYGDSLAFIKSIYKLVNQIPDRNERLRKQITNSAESIPALIAEGFAKRSSPKEFKRFLYMAMGSSDETITHAREIYILASLVRAIDRELCVEVGNKYKVISKRLNTLIKKWVGYK